MKNSTTQTNFLPKSLLLLAITTMYVATANLVEVSAADVTATNNGTSSRNATGKSRRQFGKVAGTVRDHRGQPVANAVVSLLRRVEGGADEVVRQVKSGGDGVFAVTRVAPGSYILRAVADGYDEVVFSSVNVKASDEVALRFNLVPAGRGRTMPERRADRNDSKWILRSARGGRSIFQVNEGQRSETVALGESVSSDENEEATTEVADEVSATEVSAANDQSAEEASATETAVTSGRRRTTQGVAETYFATSPAGAYAGVNFALWQNLNDRVDVAFAGQYGTRGAPQRLEAMTRVRLNERHTARLSFGAARLPLVFSQTSNINNISAENVSGNTSDAAAINGALGQFSVRAIDEWTVREGVIVVLGFDYSRFAGGSGAVADTSGASFVPRFGVQFDANARTRLRLSYAPGGDSYAAQRPAINLETGAIYFTEQNGQTAQVAVAANGQPLTERSSRAEFGVERVIDDRSGVEAAAFYDTTDGRGVGLLSQSLNSLNESSAGTFFHVANQEGAARGLRVVYTRRLSTNVRASAGYSFGRGQSLNTDLFAQLVDQNADNVKPKDLFRSQFFQTLAAQVDAEFDTGTRVRGVLRFSSRATVFAIDPFAGRLAVYDPGLSIIVTQDLPTFGLPFAAEAIVDGRNLLDAQTGAETGDANVSLSGARRMVRGGIAVRF